MKKIFYVLFLLAILPFAGPSLMGQAAPSAVGTSPKRNELQVTFLGQGGLGTLGYMRHLGKDREGRRLHHALGISLGASSFYAEDHRDAVYVLSPEYSLRIGREVKFLELGLLANLMMTVHNKEWNDPGFFGYPSLRVGYYRQSPRNRWHFRAGAVAPTLVVWGYDASFIPFPYIGTGFRF